MVAASRDEVFAELRKRGIKAIKVTAADGTKANGEMRGVRRRVVAMVALVVAAVVGGVAYLGGTRAGGTAGMAFQTDRTRRQVIGDAAVIEKGILNGWSDVFKLEGERFLASFAIPGVKAGQRNTSEKELLAALESECEIGAGDSLETQQIKAMVEGMKDEARRYIAAGGTAIGYGKRLTERQDAEIAIFKRFRTELESAKATMPEDEYMALWEARNDELRNLGIKTVGLE